MLFPQSLNKWGLQNIERRGVSALLLALLSIIVVALLPDDLSPAGKMTLGVWLLAIIGWTLTPLNDTFIALAAAIVLMLSATFDSENFFASLGNSTIWLLIGAAIIGTALNQSELPAHFTLTVTRYARTVSQLFYLLTAILLLTALIIPSVGIRTTLMMPVYTLIATAFRDQRVNRALALMLPINLMLTSVASLFGDGAHLVINDTLGQLTGRPFSFVEWSLMGLPFAAISAFGTTRVILNRFLDESQRQLPLDINSLDSRRVSDSLSWTQRYMLAVTIVLLLLWLTEPWHGLDSALIALLGAMIVTIPAVGVIKFDEAAANVSWNVIAFVGATLFLSNALVESGAGGWLVEQLLVQTGVVAFGSRLAMLVGITVVTLASHLLITSRSTRGAVIAPGVVLLAYSTGLDPQTLAFITAAGIGYSITLFISARSLLAFQRLKGDDETVLFTARDLVRLSGVLAPFHIALIVLFSLFYWPVMSAGQWVANPAQAQERLHEAPITTGRPGLLQDKAIVPVEVLNQAGIRQVNGQFQMDPLPQPTEPGTPTTTVTPPPTSTPALTLTVTPPLTATPVLTMTPVLTTTPEVTTTALTTTPVLTMTPVLTTTPEVTTTILMPTPALIVSPTLTTTPALTMTVTPALTTPATLEPTVEVVTSEPPLPTSDSPATFEPAVEDNNDDGESEDEGENDP